jgi:LPXTG-site transpeptidase (sortase) family protein
MPTLFASKKYKRRRRHHVSKMAAAHMLGNTLIIFALILVVKIFFFPIQEEVKYFVDQYTHTTYEAGNTPRGKLSSLLASNTVKILQPASTDFGIVIPKVAANAPIITQVDAANPDIYLPALQKGVAQAAGTAFPGQGGHIFLFAHSTDNFWNVGTYNAVFYLLYKIQPNDEVNLYYKGQRYVYTVTNSIIVDPSQVEYLTRKTSKELLTLQTCWPPGTTLKRLLVFASPKVK